ncbi:hypothetical protein [Streptomyces pseudogriseolus]|uniref:hypothetical protein n=1 Tax=Streptomyces pseudogriseolus TaxID=36817 RepID=UPI000A396933
MQPDELPLWIGTEVGAPADTAVTEPPAGPLNVRAEFQAVLDAWDAHVPPENGTAQDLFADLDADLATLERAFAEAVTPTTPSAVPAVTDQDAGTPGESTEPSATPQRAADVNAALQQADAHATALQDLPEWQHIQTVRGAFGRLFRVMRERAGERFDQLMGDHRVGEFEWAQAAANHLRRRGEENGRETPAADALHDVADVTTAFASPSGGRSGPPASWDVSSVMVDIPEMRQIEEALSGPLSAARDGRCTRVSAAAARGKSTTRRGTKKPDGTAKKPGAAEQAGHLRRSGAAEPQQQNHKPTKR